jgi:hypothetical protein
MSIGKSIVTYGPTSFWNSAYDSDKKCAAHSAF